jgi:hypothetical protein
MTTLPPCPEISMACLLAVPEGFSVSERVVEPVALLSRVSGKMSVRLGGKRTVRGEVRLIEAPSVSHAWIADGAILRPLPKDAPGLVAKCLGDEARTTFPTPRRSGCCGRRPRASKSKPRPMSCTRVKIAAEELPPEIHIPGLHADLFPYQARGVQWMWETVNRTGGLILADEMGLGKTLQIIALLLMDPPEKTAPALIVCPTSLIANWVREFGKFAPRPFADGSQGCASCRNLS